jgi:putative exosortase-associated protein (TIGR04073 family)
MRRRIGLVVVACMLMAPPAWAARTRFHTAAESSVYKEKTGGMLGRGLLNVVTSFVDVLTNTVNETKSGPPFMGTLVGFAKGVGCGVARLGSGAVDVVTFWVPGFNGFPVSDSYENCLSGSGASAALPEVSPAWDQAAEPTEASSIMIDAPILAIEPAAAPEPVQAAQVEPAPVWKK